MKHLFAILALTLFGTIAGFAQASSSSDDFKKAEFSATYSQADMKFKEYSRDTLLRNNSTLGNTFSKRDKFEKGFEVSGVYNFSRYIGGRAAFSLNFNGRKGRVNNQAFEVKERFTNYLFGVQLKDNKADTANRFRPFGYVMAGIANTKSTLKNCSAFGVICPGSLNRGRTGFTSAIGGGVDIKITNNISFRAIQVEYQTGKINQGVKVSTGIVF
jgi:hypothetical protein